MDTVQKLKKQAARFEIATKARTRRRICIRIGHICADQTYKNSKEMNRQLGASTGKTMKNILDSMRDDPRSSGVSVSVGE